MVEVANTQKYEDLQTKRSYWQHGSNGQIKTIILMAYQNGNVADDHTCVLEVWKTAHLAAPGDPWEFPDPPLTMSANDINPGRQETVESASATQTFLGYREGPIYVRLPQRTENSH